ncbi:MAG TPA: glycosyltransferase [Acetobacteraceae bacterium]|nr:glycosyltransferase [Acetobacteraceae bacterium]
MHAEATRAPRTVLSVFATFAVGGPQARFAALANRFGGRYRHVIVAMDGRTDARERLSPRLDVSFPEIAIRPGSLFGNLLPFRRTLKSLRPDLLLTHNWGSLEWAIANLPGLARHIHFEDGFGPEERDRQLPRRVHTRRLVLRRSTVVLPSRTLLAIAGDIWRLPPRVLHYVPNGIDLARFDGIRPERLSAPPVVGTVAALRPEKNLARLLRAYAASDVPGSLVIVGDGTERPVLQALARELGIAARTVFTGHVADPAALIAGFDLFALSSDTEQMPISVLEAMAARLPLAATDVGDVRTMLAPENRAFVVPRDDAALAAALRSLVAGPELCARIGAANRARAEQEFDQERMFAVYAALFGAGPDNHARTA